MHGFNVACHIYTSSCMKKWCMIIANFHFYLAPLLMCFPKSSWYLFNIPAGLIYWCFFKCYSSPFDCLFQEQCWFCVSTFWKCTICCKCSACSAWSVVCWEDDNCNVHGLISFSSSFMVLWVMYTEVDSQVHFLFPQCINSYHKIMKPSSRAANKRSQWKHFFGEYTIQLYYKHFQGSSTSIPHSSHLPEFWFVEIVFQWVDCGHWYVVVRRVLIAVRNPPVYGMFVIGLWQPSDVGRVICFSIFIRPSG